MFKKNHLYYALPAILISTLAVIAIVFAWQEPGDVPPLDNVPAPINVGSYFQSKLGPLTIRGQFITVTSTFLAADGGRVGIGLMNPNNLIQVKDLINFDDSIFSTAVGYRALYSNTIGQYNTAIGWAALYRNTASNNTALGYRALFDNITGSSNTAIGVHALSHNSDGIANVALGGHTLMVNTGGSYNTALGHQALNTNTTGGRNTVVGYNALLENITGSDNVIIGDNADRHNQGGSSNTIIGYRAGRSTDLHTKSGNVFIGYMAGYNETGDNKLYIANSNVNPPLIYGDFSTGRVGIGTTAPGDKLDVNGNIRASAFYYSSDISLKEDIKPLENSLVKILQLNGISYQMKETGQERLGFSAQEVAGIFPELINKDKEGLLSIEASGLIAALVEAVKEQQAQIDELKVEIEQLKNQ